MIGVGAPWVLGLAGLGALLTVVLHFLSVRKPPVLVLPTHRFLPDRPVRAVSRSARPSDLLLLLIRVVALLLIGIALAGVTWRGTGVKHGRIVVVQRGTLEDSVALLRTVGDAMRGAFAGDTVTRVVLLDSIAHVLSVAQSRAFQAETLSAAGGAGRLGDGAAPTLSAALLAATRAAGALVRDERTVETVDLVVVAPLSRASFDAALPQARALWKGALRLLDTRSDVATADNDSLAPRAVKFAGEQPNDAVSAAFAARGWIAATNSALSVANGVAGTGEKSTTAAASAAAPVALEWPSSGVPSGWLPTAPDTVGAIVARGAALVFPFVRSSRVPDEIARQGRAIAWWSDGQVAAVEIPTASSCTRHVGARLPASSDVLQGQGARALLLALSAPCGGELDRAPVPTMNAIRELTDRGAAADASTFRNATLSRTPWAALLLLLALALLVAEWWLRDREEAALRLVNDELREMRRVA